MKITFDEVKPGEKFTTRFSKRMMTCVKIEPTRIESGIVCNSVILLDHAGDPADDLGKLLWYNGALEVEVVR